MGNDAEERRRELTERAAYHVEVQRRRSEAESAKAQVLLDRFVAQAKQQGVPTEELTARPWSGSGRYRTGVVGWYLRTNRSVGVDVDGRFYVLTVPPVRFGRWRTVRVDPAPPPLVVGKGAGDGEVFDLDVLLQKRLRWTEAPPG
ncbi:hypothetical protein E4P39_04650 [Blastococcus sp. CT_GayMR19]|uniref:hypothetical protein n=1 Tax=Blastococcus sp. CT_GayMR19 TaxID=2559608 RepID=UPI0010744EAC|nr:hypothetical protein [Blastococcus sp. CT_GayMR19]TFV78483.1 hypothetical protein E4P39_04650 [Blastococcus sp. CT_GayMR19]